jgi:hypothetical protein
MTEAGATRIDVIVEIAGAAVRSAIDGNKFRPDRAELTYKRNDGRWKLTFAFLSGPNVEPDGSLSMIRRDGLRLLPGDALGVSPERINDVIRACMPEASAQDADGTIRVRSHFWACPKPDCDTPRDQDGDCPDCGEQLRLIGADGYEVTT